MPDTQVERISQLDIGDGKLYEFAGANNGMVFNDVTEALAAIKAGIVADGDVFYIKNDGTSGYPVFIGTSAQITTADNAGKIPAGMLIFCTDDSVNDITALQVSYGNTTVKAKLDGLGNTDISGIGDGTVTGGISQLNDDLSLSNNITVTGNGVKTYAQLFTELFALIDTNKVKKGAILRVGNNTVYQLCETNSNTYYEFHTVTRSDSAISIRVALLTNNISTSTYETINIDHSGTTSYSNGTSSVVTSGLVIGIAY